ncbi:hypothetical protein ACIQU6_43990 [Streptomyces sp. NPDC090442]|uniref:hypothetical protein n=1 Tax=Streptomyces sp. NPDC090442 TaxID=3365962 RepID=UPI003816534E
MPTEFRQLKQLAKALGLTYQQLLQRYRADRGDGAPRAAAIAWAQQEVQRAQEAKEREADDAAHALHASFADSRTSRWAPLIFAPSLEVHASLIRRVKVDREVLPRLSLGHYLDAALRTELPGQLACMEDLLESLGNSPLQSSSSIRVTFRLGQEAHAAVSSLKSALTAANLPHQKAHVVSALTARFLATLPQGPATSPRNRKQG